MQASIPSSQTIEKYAAVRPIPYHYGSVENSGGRFKLLLDYLMAVLTILMLMPLFLSIAVAVKLDSDGPMFYRQRMLGRNGRIFYAYRFRTISVMGMKRTRVGHFLIRTGLAELPLLINILKNEISFVGPRPVTPEQIVMYGAYAERLLSVTPGITGYWQVNGYQQGKRIEQDMQYIETCSMMNDLKILFKTVTAVFQIQK